MRFFFDNCISPRLAESLHALSRADDHEVVALRQRFDANASDEHWLLTLAEEGSWIIISGDSRIYTNSQRRKVWKQARLTSFFWQRGWNGAPYWEQAWRMVRWWPKIVAVSSSVERGVGYSVPFRPSGKLKPI